MKMRDSLSIHEARKLTLLSQRVPPSAKQTGSAAAATLSAIEHLGYIQIDTISVVQRAHHHTIWNRNPRYQPRHLDQLLDNNEVFEYWSHAAAYLPMRDFRFSLPRKRAIACGEQEHWYDRDEQLEKRVLERIAKEGPLMARDFEHDGERTGEWQTKPAKRALENLFMQGDLMTPRRVNFQKVYDLPERVLPGGVDTSEPTQEEHARHLITRYLEAHGLGQPSEIAYLRKGAKKQIAETMQEMTAAEELITIRVSDEIFHALPASLQLLNKPLARSKLKILSPFDNLVIQRKRLQSLFGFDYLIECYVPAAKRRYGYFVLPILWDGRLAARMDCKADRKESRLHIKLLEIEPWMKKTDSFIQALQKELKSFLKFNECSRLVVHKTAPKSIKPALESALDRFSK